MTLRDRILAVEDIPSELLDIPIWGVQLKIKGMSAGERVTLMQNAYDQSTQQVNMASVYPDVLVLCCFDPETDEPVFTDADKTALMGKSSAAVETIAGVALRLSGVSNSEADAAGKDS